MGYYTVATPCVVGKLHYATVPAQPIEVDDSVAAPLVKSGALQPYSPGMSSLVIGPVTGKRLEVVLQSTVAQAAHESTLKPPALRRRRRKGDPAP